MSAPRPPFRPLPPLTRRALLRRAALAPLLAGPAGAALAQGALAQGALAQGTPAAPAGDPGEWRHALALLGEPRYPADFPHFAYVNPRAPKGGLVRLAAPGTFDNLNPVVAGVKGSIAAPVVWVHEPLTTPSLDEPGAAYGLLAEAVRHPADRSSVTYRLRAAARFADGRPVTPEDVVFSLEAWKRLSPMRSRYYFDVARAEVSGEREVTFVFSVRGNRELPQIVGEMPVLPKHWYEGTAPDGARRDVGATSLEPPLGSGPYRVGEVDPGRRVTMVRRPDYWGWDLPVNLGKSNLDELRYDYYRDPTVLVEALKGDAFDYREENSARVWSTAYDVAAVREGRLIKEEIPTRSSGIMQAFVLNLRRPKFQDARVRRAFNLAFDFEELNRTTFFGLYKRCDSYFTNTELASSGLPQGRELAILEGLRDKVPAAVFTQPYANPVGGTPEAARANLREALRLLTEAGYELRDRRLVSRATGEQLSAEFLVDDPAFERALAGYRPALERLGINATIRKVDDVQYQNRVRAFDFDAITHGWGQSLSPGNEQREYWGSASAGRPGSMNLAGIRDAGVDALIERVVFATDREDLVAATRALDRVLLAHDLVVPQWTSGVLRTLRWDRFSRPDKLPEHGGAAFPTVWWYDEAKAAKTGARR